MWIINNMIKLIFCNLLFTNEQFFLLPDLHFNMHLFWNIFLTTYWSCILFNWNYLINFNRHLANTFYNSFAKIFVANNYISRIIFRLSYLKFSKQLAFNKKKKKKTKNQSEILHSRTQYVVICLFINLKRDFVYIELQNYKL